MKNILNHKSIKDRGPYKRILLLFSILSLVVVAVAVMASYDDEEGYINQAPGYEEYATDNNPGNLYSGYDAYTGDDLDASVYNGDNAGYYEYNYAPVNDQYNNYYNNYPQEVTNSGPVAIEIDNSGTIALYPPRDNHGVVLDGDYIRIYLPGFYDMTGVSVTLPDGWTYTVNHELQPRPSTVITFNHNWNAGGGYIGFMPMVVTGLPAGWSQNTLPVNATIADWNTALVGNTNHVISVPAGHTMPSGVTIPTGRNILIASYGTDLNNSPTIGHTLAGTPNVIRIDGNTRHFYVSGNATLTLSHIILDGRYTTNVPLLAGVYRGGVQVGGPAAANANLIMLTGSGIQGCQAPYGGGVLVINSTFLLQGGTVGSASASTHPFVVLDGNRARYGGGVYMRGAGSVFTISAGLIAHNYACYGGGVYATDGSDLTLTATGVIRNNWRTTQTIWIPAVEVTDPGYPDGYNRFLNINRGGGVLIRNPGTTFTMTGGTIGGEQFNDTNTQANRAERGGGVAVLDGASFYMHAGAISGNEGSTVSFAGSDAVAPTGLSVRGGGVYVYGTDSTFNMTGGIIGGIPSDALVEDSTLLAAPTGNTSTRGAGVALHGGATFTKNGDGIIAGGHTSSFRLGSNPGGVDGYPHVGGGVWVGSGGEFIFESGYIIRNRSSNSGGGIQAMYGGIVHMTGGYIAGNLTSTSGFGGDDSGGFGGGIVALTGAIVVMDGGTIGGVNLNGTLIEGNRAIRGGGVASNGFMTVQTESGAVVVPATFIFNDGTIGGNRTISGGIMSNHAGVTGGGVFVQAGAWFHMADGEIIGNQAPDGGGVAANFFSAFFTMDGGVIGGTNAAAHHNIATNGAGGGVRVTNSGRFLLTNGHIINNRANRGAGVSVGGVAVALPTSLVAPLNEYIPHVEVYYTNLAGQEQRMLMHYDAMQMLSQLLDDDGGNHYQDYYIGTAPHYYTGESPYGYIGTAPAYLELGAEGEGPIPLVPVSGLLIPARPPTPTEQFRMDGTNVIIEGGRNTAGGITNAAEGGGVHVAGGATYRMLNGTIRDNRANHGGGVFVTGTGSFFHMHSGIVGHASNRVQSNRAAQGGGVWVGGGATFNMQDYTPSGGGAPILGTGEIANNTATATTAAGSGGGGVWVMGAGSTFNLSAGAITSNISESGGGGVHVHGSETGTHVVFTMTGGEIAYNETTGTVAGMGGAGVRLMNYTARFIMGTEGAPTGAVFPVIRNNICAHSGGGIGIPQNVGRGSIVTMHSGLITNNTATGGGGVAIGSSSTFNLRGGTISNNQAQAAGGGVSLGHGMTSVISLNSYFDMSGGIIENNRAVNGGGVNVSAQIGHSYFTMTGGTIRNNRFINALSTAPIEEGGGVRVDGTRATFTMTGGTVGGERPSNLPDGTPNPYSNTALNGGGVWVGDGASFYMNEGGGGANPVTSGTVVGNMSIGTGNNNGGGGVFVTGADSTFELEAGVIEHNDAAVNGGGVSVEHNSHFTMEGGIIHNNFATNDGGGVFIRNGAIFDMRSGVIGGPLGCPANCDVHQPGDCDPGQGNTAINGGGVYVGDNASFNLLGNLAKTITGNDAHYGGGVWVAETGIMQMQAAPQATNVHITHNTAEYMGGGIFTMNHEYSNPLPPNRIPPPGGTAVGVAIAYSNLVLRDVTFAYNAANQRFIPPVNATAVLPANTFLTITAPIPTAPAHIHPLNNFDINFRVFTVDFQFHKTDNYIHNRDQWTTPGFINSTLLPGATFSIYRYTGGSTPANTIVTQAMITAGTWVYVDTATSTGNTATPIEFALLPGMYYMLIETAPPAGFQMPMGQWRIRSVERVVSGTTEVGFRVVTISEGTPAPGFINILPGGIGNSVNATYNAYFGGIFYLGNWLNIELPLTGGMSNDIKVMIFTATGLATMSTAIWIMFIVKKRMTLKPVSDRYSELNEKQS